MQTDMDCKVCLLTIQFKLSFVNEKTVNFFTCNNIVFAELLYHFQSGTQNKLIFLFRSELWFNLEFEKIKGGWKNVSPNLKTKTQLTSMGLKPIDVNKYRPEVWSNKSWVKLYDVELDTKPKKKPTEAQLKALEKAKEARIKNLTFDYCNEPESFVESNEGNTK
ncbi:hypothetical protein AM499_08900 [Bacillus sp. FJAT-22090]|uniref:hypothetical protein n=1 Tax=Bacillus sp. FJAT-22090 TaxID=1581038 RepID=UPI0006ADCC32|nr:hypothetical protein [Bacillus sp. FJAT-22090]ALC85929.1 hypothetical protein AM499_08900 [Bacillus sp. FJAT-22090]